MMSSFPSDVDLLGVPFVRPPVFLPFAMVLSVVFGGLDGWCSWCGGLVELKIKSRYKDNGVSL